MIKTIMASLMVIIGISSLSARVVIIPEDYPTIQEGIDSCADGDTVLIKPGIYYENLFMMSANIILASFYLSTGDTTYISTTIVDGTSSGSVVNVMTMDSTAAIIGLTLTHGLASEGGGIYCTSDIRILHNIITENNAVHFGGGIYCMNHYSPLIERNKIIGNYTNYGDTYGGGIYCRYTDAIIRNNVISSNNSCWGGGIACYISGAKIEQNLIYQNYADP